MKKFVTLVLFLFSILTIFASIHHDEHVVIGLWETAEKDAHIQIYKSGNLFYGKMIWMKFPHEKDGINLKKDIHNPDSKQKSRTLLNMHLLYDFKYEDGMWQDGKVYDPTSGKTYSAEMEIEKNGKLKLTGYIGISLLGKSVLWNRLK